MNNIQVIATTPHRTPAELIEERLLQMLEDGLLGQESNIPNMIHRAANEIAHDQETRTVPLSRQRREAFLLALASSLSVGAAEIPPHKPHTPTRTRGTQALKEALSGCSGPERCATCRPDAVPNFRTEHT